MTKTFSIKTFGCKLNQYESGRISEELTLRGYAKREFGDSVDFTVINTCSVTDNSEKKCRNSIRAASRNSQVVVAGCMAEFARTDIEKICASALIIPNADKKDLGGLCDSIVALEGNDSPEHHPPYASEEIETSGRSRGYLKVQDGCDGSCSYCIVPAVRGIPVSRPADEILNEVRTLLDRGFFEIALTGVTIGKYFSDGLNFSGLVEKIIGIEGGFRLRVTSIEPKHVDDRLISLFSSPKMCRHIHLPLQSGSDEVLSAMNRPYTASEFLSVVERINRADDEIAVGADVIAGFPAETAKDFKQTLSVVSRASFAYVHQFRFSPRRGTPAAALKQQSKGDEISARLDALKSLSDELSIRYRSRFINKILPCVAHRGNNDLTAVSDNYIKIKVARDGLPLHGQIGVLLQSAGKINTGQIHREPKP